MDDYARTKTAPLNCQAGYIFAGAELRGKEETEPTELVLSFEGAPEVVVSVWHGMGASGFHIEVEGSAATRPQGDQQCDS
jgi:hypothetical protein